MLPKIEKNIIIGFARQYKVSSVILFGSCSKENEEYNDIDIGVKGVAPELFFKFYAELYKHLSKPVDLVDISSKSSFNMFVEETGVKIYG